METNAKYLLTQRGFLLPHHLTCSNCPPLIKGDSHYPPQSSYRGPHGGQWQSPPPPVSLGTTLFLKQMHDGPKVVQVDWCNPNLEFSRSKHYNWNVAHASLSGMCAKLHSATEIYQVRRLNRVFCKVLLLTRKAYQSKKDNRLPCDLFHTNSSLRVA